MSLKIRVRVRVERERRERGGREARVTTGRMGQVCLVRLGLCLAWPMSCLCPCLVFALVLSLPLSCLDLLRCLFRPSLGLGSCIYFGSCFSIKFTENLTVLSLESRVRVRVRIKVRVRVRVRVLG